MNPSARFIVPLVEILISTAVLAQGEVVATKVTDDVLVIRGLVANMAVLRTDDGLVVVDSLISPLHARRARAVIAEHFPHQSIRYLINTHYHLDHNFGNQEFPEATVVAHAKNVERFGDTLDFAETAMRAPTELDRLLEEVTTTEDLGAQQFDQIRLWQKRLARYSGFQARTADVRLEGSAMLSLGGKDIQLLHLGPGHTDGDLVVLFEQDRVLVTGDLVFHRIVPVIDPDGGCDIKGWLAALAELSDLEGVLHVVPGHGEPGGREMLMEQSSYLHDLWQAVTSAHSEGLTVEEAAATITLARYDSYERLFNDVATNVEESWKILARSE